MLAVVFIIAEGVLPVLVLVLMGRVAGAIPDAVTFGLSSPQGHRLILALALAGCAYALSLMRGPLEDALTAAAAARVDGLMQRRLVQAVSRAGGHRAPRGSGRARAALLRARRAARAASRRVRRWR